MLKTYMLNTWFSNRIQLTCVAKMLVLRKRIVCIRVAKLTEDFFKDDIERTFRIPYVINVLFQSTFSKHS